MGAVAGQVDENQVFRTAALSQGLGGARQVFPGSHRPVGEVVAVVDQTELPLGTETAGQHLADEVGFAQEHALLAITGQGQAVQFDVGR
ncbi:hypothetical protein D3C71_1946220 [compost metagenome]